MFKKYSKTLVLMLGAFMFFTISMKANYTTTVGTSVEINFDSETAFDYDLTIEASSYTKGRAAGRRVGAAVGRVAFIATLAYQVASDVVGNLIGGNEDTINPSFALDEDLSKFDL